MNRLLWSVFGLGLLAGLWLLLSMALGESLVPFPDKVMLRAWELFPQAAGDLGLTLLRTLGGFLGALGVGLGMGLWMGKHRQADGLLYLPAALLQSAPPLLWAIPLVLILGPEGWAPLAVVFLVTLPLVIFSIREARQAIPAAALDVFRVYAPRRYLVLRELYLPALTPALRSLFTLGLLLGLKSAILGEWFGAQNGIGRWINEAYVLVNMPNFYALSLIYLITAAALTVALDLVVKKVLPLRRSSSTSDLGYARSRKGLSFADFPSPSALDIQNLSFSWTRRPLLENLSLSIAPGEIVVLSGNSGAGKTTLARLALGLLKPRTGLVVSPKKPAFLFQDDGLLAHRDCLGNVLLGPWAQDNPRGLDEAWNALDAVGLGDFAGAFPEELSGGMRKRLALARALAHKPDFFVLDEPFQNLHPEGRRELWDLFFDLVVSHRIPVLIITHYPEELASRRARFLKLNEHALKILQP